MKTIRTLILPLKYQALKFSQVKNIVSCVLFMCLLTLPCCLTGINFLY